MNLFRSEEHVRNWRGYDPASADGTMRLADWARVFAAEGFRRRLEPDYLVLRSGMVRAGTVLAELGKTTGPFWGAAPRR